MYEENEAEMKEATFQYQRILIISILVASLVAPAMPVLIVPPSVSASETADTTLSVHNTTTNFTEHVTIPINVSNAVDIGSMDISLRYNHAVLALKTVEKGNLTHDSVMQWNTKDDSVLIGLIDANGINGNGSLAILSFDVLGYPGSTSDLDLEATANNVTDFSAVPLTIYDAVFSVRETETGTAVVRVENMSGLYGAKVKISLTVSSVVQVGSLDIVFTYNPNVLGLENIRSGSLTGNSSMVTNTDTAGTVKIALADATGFSGNGSAVILECMVWGQPGDTSPLTLDLVEAHEFNTTLALPVVKRSGTLTVTGIAFEASSIFVNNVSAAYGSKVKIPINVSSIAKVGSLDIVFQYNPDLLGLTNVSAGDLTHNSCMESDTETAGTAKIALADEEGFNGTGSVVVMEFIVWGQPGDKIPLTLDSVEAHEFDTALEIPVVKRSGTLTVTGTAFEASSIFVNNVSGMYGAKVKIPMNISSVAKIGSLDIVFGYDSDVLSLVKIRKGDLTENSSMVLNTDTAGTVKIALADASGFSGNGSAVILECMVWGQPGDTGDLMLDMVEAHEFNTSLEIPVMKRNGMFTVTGIAFDTLTVSVSNVSGEYGGNVHIPVTISYTKENSSIGSMDVVLKYNSDVLTIINVSSGNLTANSSIAANMDTPGAVKIALADSAGVNGSDSVIMLNVDVVGLPGASSQLILDNVAVNEFNTHMKLPVIVQNGVVTVNESGFGVIHAAIGTFTGNYGDVIQVPVNISYNTSTIGSMEFALKYDPRILTVEKIDKGMLTKNASLVCNTAVDGTIKTALADSTGFDGTGSVALITFNVWGHYGDVSILSLESVTANDFKSTLEIPVAEENGIFINGGKQVSGIHCSILNMTGAIGSVLQLPVVVSGAKDLGSMDISLSYDANVLKAVNVSEGSLTADYFEWHIKENNVSVARIDNEGVTGDGTAALVDFEVVGFARTESNVTVKVEAYDVDEFAPIPVTKRDGVFTDLITVKSPNGCELWYDVQNITWLTASDAPGIIAPSGVLKVNISLYDGYGYKPVANDLNNTGFYLWDTKKLADGTEVPDGSSYKIKVNARYADSTHSNDVSDTWFTIYNKIEVIITPSAEQSVTEGENATYFIELFNKQPYEDTFVLTVKNTDNAAIAELNQSSVTIPAFGAKRVTLCVADESVGRYRVIVNATSENVTGEAMLETEVMPGFSFGIEPESYKTSIGGNASYEITITNHQKVPDVFTLNVTGISSGWFTTGSSYYLIPGEKKEVALILPISEDLGNVGKFSINSSITSSNLGKTRYASAELTVVRDPILSDLMPANGTRSGSRDVLFTWKTSCNSTTELFIRAETETNYARINGTAGTQHSIYVKGLERNTGYEFFVRSNSSYGSTTSDVRSLYITNGIVFENKIYNVTVKKDYDQQVTIYVENTDRKPHDLLLHVSSAYEDLAVGFIGAGAMGKVVTLEPSERKSVTLAIHAQDAVEEEYVLALNLTNLGKEEIRDHAHVNVHVQHPHINFTLEEIKTDPVTLTKTLRIKNYGDIVNDLSVFVSDEIVSKVSFKPKIEHYRLGIGRSVEFDVVPVLTKEFKGMNGTIAALGSGMMVYLPINFTLPSGKKVFIGRINETQVKGDLRIVGNVTSATENEVNVIYMFPDSPNSVIIVTYNLSKFSGDPLSYNESFDLTEIEGRLILTAKFLIPENEDLTGTIEEMSLRAEFSGNAAEKLHRVEWIHIEYEERLQNFSSSTPYTKSSGFWEHVPMVGNWIKSQKLVDWLLKNKLIDKEQHERLLAHNWFLRPLVKFSKLLPTSPKGAVDAAFNLAIKEALYSYWCAHLEEIPDRFKKYYQGGGGPGYYKGINVDGIANEFMSDKGVVSDSYSVSHYGCLNKPDFTGSFNLPSTVQEQNVADPTLILHLTSPEGNDYKPFDINALVNGNKVGTIENTVPNGHYFFEADPSLLNYAKDGAAKNTITLDSPDMNRGYYISSSGVDVVFCLKDIEIPVVASNQEEANEIIMNLSDLMMLKPDFGVYFEDITFSNAKPSHGEEITINVIIYNLGTLGAGAVPIQLVDNNIPLWNRSILCLPPFQKETVSFKWSGLGGSHRISVKINQDKTIDESDYTNNEAYKDINVARKTDFTPPEITNVQVSNITTSRATITWDTDELSSSLVKYGESPVNYTVSKSDSRYVLTHGITLTGLKENTTYYYVVNSTDKSINSAESSEYTFTTFPTDVTPPAGVSGLNETDRGTTWIRWRWIYPFEPDFSHTMVYINGTFAANVSAPEHSFNATGLKPTTTYEIGTRTVDVSENINTTWVNDTAATLEDREPPASITNLQNTTGPTWITWTWDNPTDADFNYTMVYVNGTWQTNTSYPVYNATELVSNAYYEIGTHTVDTVGNVNETWVNQTTKIHAVADLIIGGIWVNGAENCTICYIVTNIGKGTAPRGHNTSLFVDGEEVAHDSVPVSLTHNESSIGCFYYNWTYTPPNENITVCADYNNTINESSEFNNCQTTIWRCGDLNGDGAVDMSDVIDLLYYTGYPGTYTICSEWAADVNGDEQIDRSDVRKLLHYIGYPGLYELNCCCA